MIDWPSGWSEEARDRGHIVERVVGSCGRGGGAAVGGSVVAGAGAGDRRHADLAADHAGVVDGF